MQKPKPLKVNSNLAAGVATCWLGKKSIFAFGDGKLLVDGTPVLPHQGGILAMVAAGDLGVIITCGDDGSVVATDTNGRSHVKWGDPNAWLDALAYNSHRHCIAVSSGRHVIIIGLSDDNLPAVKLKPGRAPTSLAFSGDGRFLAIGHSAGVSLFDLTQPHSNCLEFPCSGGPLSVALDHKGDFLFAGLSEPALAGWRLSDGQGFRMGGYPGKPRQLVWSHNGNALLTSGGPALLVWPMTGPDGCTIIGPMGQAAGVYRPRLGMLTAVAIAQDRAVTGWSDGGIDLINLTDGTSCHIGGPRPPKDLDKDPRTLTTNVVSVAFRDDGKQVSWISETGTYGTAAVQ